jgi:hypothetical protein
MCVIEYRKTTHTNKFKNIDNNNKKRRKRRRKKMSAYDKVIHVKTLLSSKTSTSISSFSKLIQDSRNKVANILNRHRRRGLYGFGASSTECDENDELSVDSNQALEVYTGGNSLYTISSEQQEELFKSMIKLTNFVLYDVCSTNSADGKSYFY